MPDGCRLSEVCGHCGEGGSCFVHSCVPSRLGRVLPAECGRLLSPHKHSATRWPLAPRCLGIALVEWGSGPAWAHALAPQPLPLSSRGLPPGQRLSSWAVASSGCWLHVACRHRAHLQAGSAQEGRSAGPGRCTVEPDHSWDWGFQSHVKTFSRNVSITAAPTDAQVLAVFFSCLFSF